MRLSLLGLAVLLQPQSATAEEPAPAIFKSDLGLITGSTTPAEPQSASQQYCVNIADQAADARFAWQAKTISELEKEIDKRLAELEAKRAEYQEWAKEREDTLARASDHVVEIYAKMKAESAALQLAVLEDQIAAAVLSKLNVRTASAILNEMEPGRAAQLTKAMIESSRGGAAGKKS
jgi:flagellar motility protein MotE (MotC chaperone)